MIYKVPRYIFFFFILVTSGSAQFFYFGRNKVQYTEFDWHILKTEHFDIYYYPEMQGLAERGAFFAEESYKVLEQKFNHNVGNRIPLIFYSSHLHFQQTNTTAGFIPEGVGGFFEFLKGRVVIPYDGSMWDFRHVIRHELVHVFMHSKINRVLLDHHLQQDHLPPLWFVEGLAEYWSTEWDGQAEMVLRDAVVSNYLVPLRDIESIFGSYLMYKEGQNILQFIGERYGEDKILFFMENFWKSGSFEEVFKFTTERTFKQFDEEWTYALKKKYYPLLSTLDQPSGASHSLVTEGFNSKPVFYKRNGKKEIYFIGNHNGYTSIYRTLLDTTHDKPNVVVEGEKTDEFEAFHLFQSKMSMSGNGVLAFVTKSGENDALHLYDVNSEHIVGTYHFKDLVTLGSLSWSPDGKQIVFSSIDKSGNNDLYLWDVATEKLTRLTNDVYDDRDPSWSPDGTTIVFSSDRTPYGEHGKYNLMSYAFRTNEIRYITYGDESYSSPSFSPDGNKLVFTSDVDGARNVWMMKLDSTRGSSVEMRKLTQFTTAAFDPIFADSDLVFVGFENFSFQIRGIENVSTAYDSATTSRKMDFTPVTPPWKPQSLTASSEAKPLRYAGEYSLDIAQSQIATDPVFGTQGGAYLALSDLLGNEQYYFLLYNTAQTTGELLSSFNVAVSRISFQQRTNFAYGIYRFSGRRYDFGPDQFFFERVFGGYFTLSYPLSKFQRISSVMSLSYSKKELTNSDFTTDDEENIDRTRRALFLSNSLSFTHDNSLWGPSGPIDGSRFNITLAYTTDIQNSNANYYSVIFDYRRYFRLTQRTAYATRFWLFYNDGREARRFVMGGSWDLRGFPRWSLRGKKLWLTSHELRFPFLDELALRFPFGGVSFVGFRGALFFDAGNAWDDSYEETLGSIGGGLRLSLGGALVLRYDIGKTIVGNFTKLEHGMFHQFFFGYDF
jgi:WD40 repeat protein